MISMVRFFNHLRLDKASTLEEIMFSNFVWKAYRKEKNGE